ncbi:DUF1580 domain-containing protein [Mariniblastus sp.]|nr:DUF1580 domain-containing protein [Mariniblastus sp.]
MIDVTKETLIPFRDVPAWTKERLGKRIHPSTIHRWRLRGVRGVRLETLLIGGTRNTSAEALSRFFAATTAAADGESVAVVSNVPDAKRVTAAEAYLAAEGV